MNPKTVSFQRRRRQVMAGLALAPWVAGAEAAASAAVSAAAAGPVTWAKPTGKVRVLSQRGMPASAAFAAELLATGATVSRPFDDLGRLLYDDLTSFWQTRDGVLSGLTDAHAYFCIERVALDHGWRAVHLELSSGPDAHGVAARAQAVTALAAQPQRWQAASLSWSLEAPLQWVTWAIVPRERLA